MGNLVAIVGRPNVGKSTLFNRLTKTRQAIVNEKRVQPATDNMASLSGWAVNSLWLTPVDGWSTRMMSLKRKSVSRYYWLWKKRMSFCL